MKTIKLLIGGETVYYDWRKFEKFYKDALGKEESRFAKIMTAGGVSKGGRVRAHGGAAHAPVTEQTAKFFRGYMELTWKTFVRCARRDPGAALKEGPENKFTTESDLYSAEKPVSDPKLIKIHEGVKKLLDHLKLSIKEDENAKHPHLFKFSRIVVPPKDRFYSSSNYNHAILHEAVHMISWKNRLCEDLLVSHALNANGPKDIFEIERDVLSGKTGRLSQVQKNFAVNHALDEFSVEKAASFLMLKMGIAPDTRDKTDTMRYLGNQTKVLMAAAGRQKGMEEIGKRYAQQIELVKIHAERTCEKALGQDGLNMASKSRDKGMSR